MPQTIKNNSSAQYQWAQELVGKLRLSGRERVLDIGCGDGRVTAAIAADLPQGSITGIDNSPEMIRFAQEQFPPALHHNLTFIHMNARYLEFVEAFDVFFSKAALHWIPYQNPLLSGIARSLCPGGRVLLQMAGKGNAAQIFKALTVTLTNPSWEKYFPGPHLPSVFSSLLKITVNGWQKPGLSRSAWNCYQKI